MKRSKDYQQALAFVESLTPYQRGRLMILMLLDKARTKKVSK